MSIEKSRLKKDPILTAMLSTLISLVTFSILLCLFSVSLPVFSCMLLKSSVSVMIQLVEGIFIVQSLVAFTPITPNVAGPWGLTPVISIRL